MRRWLFVLTWASLAMLLPSVALASFGVPSPTLASSFGAHLFKRVFGETTDRIASYEAVLGDPSAESPLRQFAFHVDTHGRSLSRTTTTLAPLPLLGRNAFGAARFTVPVVTLSDPAFAPPVIHPDAAPRKPSVPVVGYYQAPTDESAPALPYSYRFDLHEGVTDDGLVTFSPILNPEAGFDAAEGGPGTPAILPSAQAALSVPIRVGNIRFQTHAEAAQVEGTQLPLADRAVGAGATFDVRAGSRDLGVNLTSGYEHLTSESAPLAASAFDSSTQIGILGDQAPIFVPAYADVSKHTLSADVALPVTHALTANLQIGQQHLLGGYGAPGLENLDADNTIYGANLTFKLPKSSSSISLSANSYHYQDNIVPSNAFNQTNANLNFTVKF
jgi:hypothetical protein